ncbi:MAG: hypothetical protein FWH12_02500 [Treponema sp.]|nr:hypothetical protein [Treponema sp.]
MEEDKNGEESTPEKWSWDVFKIKTFCWRNFIWFISTSFVAVMLFLSNGDIDSVVNIILAGVWGALSIILVLHKAFEKAVGNAQIKAELNTSMQLNGEMSSIIKSMAKKGEA